MEVFTMDEFKRKAKIKELKEKTVKKGEDCWRWICDNKDLAIPIGVAVIGCFTTVAKSVGKNINLRKEEKNKTRYCYDPSLGNYYHLRRELSSREWVEVDRRKQNGERLSHILDDIGVLA